MLNEFKELEKQIDISKIVYENENLWPFFRNKLANSYVDHQFPKAKKSFLKKMVLLPRLIKNCFKLVLSLREHDFIFFTTSDDYRVVDNIRINRLLNEFTLGLGDKNILELQSGETLEKNENLGNIYYIYSRILVLLQLIISKFIFCKSTLEIEKEMHLHGISLNVKKTIKEFLAYKLLYTLLFKIINPKMIVTTCYSNMLAIKCANDLGIKTLEFQHGIISEHYAYMIGRHANSSFYPTYMAVFGDNDKLLMKDACYIEDNNNIFSVGNKLISFYRNKKTKTIIDLKLKYSKLFAITLQWTVLEEVIAYIKKEANVNQDYCFILIPRIKGELDSYSFQAENIKSFPEYNCYEIVSSVDYHFTIYSTCAYEAPSLGVKNIFFNVGGMSVDLFGEYINMYDFNFLLEENESMVDIVQSDEEYLTKENIILQNSGVIANEYEVNIVKMLKEIR